MKYPIGIQSFDRLREDGFVYVDKTALVYNLVQTGSIYFLSRPQLPKYPSIVASSTPGWVYGPPLKSMRKIGYCNQSFSRSAIASPSKSSFRP